MGHAWKRQQTLPSVERPVGRMKNGRGNCEKDFKGAGCMNLVAAV